MFFFYFINILSIMRTIIHDLKSNDLINSKKDDIILTGENSNNCIGCFRCWLSTPLNCIFNDSLHNNGNILLNTDELIIISKNVHGCYSSKIKKILERSISYVEPYFTIRDKELHHRLRNDKRIKLKVYLYGNITDNDKFVFNTLLKANKKNFDNSSISVNYIDGNIKELIL